MMLVKAAVDTNSSKIEDIALNQVGPRFSKFVSFLNLIVLNSFVFSSIVYVKNAMCEITRKMLPNDDSSLLFLAFSSKVSHTGLKLEGCGDYVWGTLFTLLLIPCSMPRNLSNLKFASLIGVICSIFLAMSISTVFFTDRNLVSS